MNWQIIVGIFFFIGGIGNIGANFGAFLFGILLGGALLFWGLCKKGYIKIKRKILPSKSRTLTEETFQLVGVNYYSESISKLAWTNPDWKLSVDKLISERKTGRKIYKHYYTNKPVKLILEPDNEHDPNTVAALIAGELVGYFSREDNVHVRKILNGNEIKSISAFIGGGEYKIVSDDGNVFKTEIGNSVRISIKYV